MSTQSPAYRTPGSELAASDIKAYLKQHEEKDLLRFLTAGSVDDGKSTLIGRLLYDCKMIYEDQLQALVSDSAVHGTTDTDFDPALLTDGLRAEREQGITIDVAYRYFSTDRRKFIIADAPGHEQYTRNMATGASTCNLAVILIDARYGVLDQTRRHSFIASLLGIKHLVAAVNKMDLVDYAESVFFDIRRQYEGFAARLEVNDIYFVPLSALKGDNVVDRSENMPWFKGAPLLEHLENVQIASDRNLIDLRLPVQYVLRPDLNFRGYCGTLASGILRQGDAVRVLPSGQKSRVKSIVTFDGKLEEAFAPMAVTVTLDDEIDVSRGDVLSHVNNVPSVGREFDANLVWMNETALQVGQTYLLKSAANTVPASIDTVRYRFDINLLHRKEADTLELNEIGRVAVGLHRVIPFDPYTRSRQTGAFVLIDRLTNATVAAGMVLDREPGGLEPSQPGRHAVRSAHVHSHQSLVTPAQRRERLGFAPLTVWLTGLPKSGKSAVAYALEAKLFGQGLLGQVLDGGSLRSGLNRDLGFDADDRAENVRRTAGMARLLNDAGLIAIVALVSPREADRKAARERVGADRFVEVFVDTPLEMCEARDQEGLYEMARRGEIEAFSGVTAPYEAPVCPDWRLDGGRLSVDEAVSQVTHLLRERGLLG